MGRWMEKARSQCFDGVLPLQRNPIKNIATVVHHLHFNVFLPTFPCFFQDAIEEIYNKDASFSIHLKKCIYFCAMPSSGVIPKAKKG
jgi:hypothetical protein